ncbi:glycosyltransferase [Sporosarcina sp. E16_8]|uniref:glycosyltransferase n=1 Tax=Sporosarcina sp. E16_8 TaxID=2789295 RepID=UPI001A91CA2C|nr:glycosyltransferase [Sporosarcina sp. E16_8]MBO0589174.1 beta(1,3)galactosyltransferase EpsH [Sporosarcina sp. E16_8]
MIFVTLGTQRFQMNRIITEIDKLVEQKKISSSDIIIQSGISNKSKYVRCSPFMEESEFNREVEKCEILVTHAGTSSIIKGLKHNKKVIVIPRLKEYGEHVDNHQLEIAGVFHTQSFVKAIDDISDLWCTLGRIKTTEMETYKSTGELSQYIVNKFLS